MNTSWNVLFKVAGIYVIALLLWTLFNSAIGYFFAPFVTYGQSLSSANSKLVLLIPVGLIYYLLVPYVIAGLFFHRYTSNYPDSETRLTLNMLLALAGFLLLSILGIIEISGNYGRLIKDHLDLANILFVLVFLAASYAMNLLLASIGLTIGLFFTRKKFIN